MRGGSDIDGVVLGPLNGGAAGVGDRDPASLGPDPVRRAPVRRVAGLVAAALAVGVVAVAAGAAGRPATPVSVAQTSGRQVQTSFGVVTVSDVRRLPALAVPSGSAGHDGGHGEAGAPSSGPAEGAAEPASRRPLRVDVTLDNRLDRSVLYSPGQFRLRVGDPGVTLAPLDAGRVAGPLPGRSRSRTWVSFLAPPGDRDLALEFTEAWGDRPIRMTLDRAVTAPGDGGKTDG